MHSAIPHRPALIRFRPPLYAACNQTAQQDSVRLIWVQCRASWPDFICASTSTPAHKIGEQYEKDAAFYSAPFEVNYFGSDTVRAVCIW
jgi:hypothetical protein